MWYRTRRYNIEITRDVAPKKKLQKRYAFNFDSNRIQSEYKLDLDILARKAFRFHAREMGFPSSERKIFRFKFQA